MKRIFTIIAAVLLTASAFAQSPERMSYQAVIRNSSDQLVTSQQIGIQISILQGSTDGTAVYVETQTSTTNANGLISIEIGTGTTTDDFSAIDWESGLYFIKIETDPTGSTNYTITGTSQLLSVPYALHAKTAESVTTITITGNETAFDSWDKNEADDFDGQYSSLTGTPANVSEFTNDAGYLTTFSEVDGSITNEIQTISRAGLTVTLTDGGTYQDSINTYTAGTGIDITNNVISTTGSSGHYVGELYGGGIIFWVTSDGQHGLIASLDDLDGGSGVAWSATQSTEIGASAQNFYDGASNTAAIVTQDNTTGYAATLCDSYSNDGFSDWYLPSHSELELLGDTRVAINNILANDGNSATNGLNLSNSSPYGYYWSSTEYSNNDAWNMEICYGEMDAGDDYGKDATYRVRAVRAF